MSIISQFFKKTSHIIQKRKETKRIRAIYLICCLSDKSKEQFAALTLFSPETSAHVAAEMAVSLGQFLPVLKTTSFCRAYS